MAALFSSAITSQVTVKTACEELQRHHDLSLETLHIHLDDENWLELSALKGSSPTLQHFADHIIAERFVKYDHIVMIPMPSSAPKQKDRRHRALRHSTPHRHTAAT